MCAARVGRDRDRGVRAGVLREPVRVDGAAVFEHYGIGLWTPEVGGRVDWHAEDHEETMPALGLSSKREITRTRIGCGPRWSAAHGDSTCPSAVQRAPRSADLCTWPAVGAN